MEISTAQTRDGMLNLDTHILLDFARGNFSSKEERVLEQFFPHFMISDIVLWEIAKLKAKGRIEIDLNDPCFKEILSLLTILPISTEIANQSVFLDIQSDPADEIILATSIIHKIPLMTRDERILKSKKVEFV